MESDIAKVVFKSEDYYAAGKYVINFFEEIINSESNSSFNMKVTPLESENIKKILVRDIRLNGETLIESDFTKEEIYDGKQDKEIFNYLCYLKTKINSVKDDETEPIFFESKKESKNSKAILEKITRFMNLTSMVGISDFKIKE